MPVTAWHQGGAAPTAIRPARPDEAPHLSGLALRAKGHWGYDAAFLERCRAELTLTAEEIRSRPVAVYAERGRVLGFYALSLAGGRADIEHFFVEPEAIGRGIGAALWRHLRSEAVLRGIAQLAVTTDPFAEGFYLHLGFARVGERPSGSIPGRMLPYMEMRVAAA
ncbi:MAG: GNAT family N-acetyltransferase [Alphaproteobacteria bacterium]